MKIIFVGLSFILLVYLFLFPYTMFPDGVGYFSYLSTLFYDHDLQLYNDFINMKMNVPPALTDTGYISNNWPFGGAFFWSPFFLTAKAFANPSLSPYDNWYLYWVNFGTMFYGVLAALLLYGLWNEGGEKNWRKALIVAAAIIGTPAFFFFFMVPANAIGLTAFVSTAFIWYWFKSSKNPDRPERYILLGLILGAGAMIRQQEALLGLAPMAELILRVMKRETKPGKALVNFAIMGVSFIVAFSPQSLIWKIVNGSFFAAPSKFNLSWKYFALDKTLFSSYHGLLFWTPVYFSAFAGLVLGVFRKPAIYLGLILIFVAQLLTNSFCVAFWEGFSFGLRQMTSLLPVVFLGLMELYKSVRNRDVWLKTLGNVLIFVPTLWTAGLAMSFISGLELNFPLSGKALLLAQANNLVNLFDLPGILAAAPRPNIESYAGMILIGLVFFGLAFLLKKGVEQYRLKTIIGVFLAIIAAFDLMIVRAAANKPAYTIPRDRVITPQQLDEFFIRQAEDIREKYHLQ
jgi:hypothetical protein